ncbi:hypothetical protein B0H19DRAFT_1132329 [Mycena capillaripes]|nr:hypothetical protein B0H19DRAFT_1132329 [Mycena capillaripes]
MQLAHALEQNAYNMSPRGAIATLARVSKMTSGPALDLLWTKLTVPSHIIDLLPEDAIQLNPSRQFYDLKRPLKESDLVAFDKYAPRVLFVDFSSSFTGIGAGCELFSTLKTFRDPVFPHLLELKWHPTARFNTLGTFHLISQKNCIPRDHLCLTMWGNVNARDAPHNFVESKFITGAGLAETIDLFQQPLSSWLPDVPSLSMNTGTYLAKPNILEGLRSLSNFQHFYARSSGSLGVDILVHLARLPHLKTLHIGDEPERPIVMLQEAVKYQGMDGPSSFPALEGVEIYGPLSALRVFLTVITSNFLHSACVNVTDLHPIDSSVFTLLTTPSTRLSTLRHFIFHTGDGHAGSERRALFAMGMFEPLLGCTNLEKLDINFDAHKVEFHDADLERMATAWPQLASLKIYSRCTQQSNWADPQVHLYTLWSFVEKCRDLCELEMAIDARVDGPFVPPPGSSVFGLYSMNRINFFLSPCRAPTHVAEFINRAFPHLADFFAGAPTGGTGSGLQTWEEVKEALPGVDRVWRAMRLAFANDETTVAFD